MNEDFLKESKDINDMYNSLVNGMQSSKFNQEDDEYEITRQQQINKLRKKDKELEARLEFINTKADMLRDALSIQLNLLTQVDRKISFAMGFSLISLVLVLSLIIFFT